MLLNDFYCSTTNRGWVTRTGSFSKNSSFAPEFASHIATYRPPIDAVSRRQSSSSFTHLDFSLNNRAPFWVNSTAETAFPPLSHHIAVIRGEIALVASLTRLVPFRLESARRRFLPRVAWKAQEGRHFVELT